MSTSLRWPVTGSGSGGGISKYANFAGLPGSASIGDLAITVDTLIVYVWNGSAWVAESTPGTDITSINSDSTTAQTITTGTTGTDVGVSTAAGTHTINIPVASAVNTGKLSSTDWSTFNGKQAALGFTPENVSNKSTSTSLGASDTLYPSQNAVKSYVDTGLSAKENLTNKSTSTSLGSSDTLFPTQNAVKSYVDTGLSAKVAKAGDTMTGNLTFSSAAHIQLDNNASNPAYNEGKVFYDRTEHALSYYNDAANVTLQVGQETLVRVRNNTGSILADGAAVYISGANSQRPTVALAKADAPATAERLIGLVTDAIGINAEGYVCISGMVNGINTVSFADGNEVWLSPTIAGGLTATKPSEPNYAISVGVVAYANASNGKILVHPDNRSLIGKQNQYNGVEDASKVAFSYNNSTRVMTITYSAGAAVWVGGVRYPKSGTYNFAAHANATNQYFYYIDNTGTETVSTSAWDLLTTAPIVQVYYSATKADGFVIDERHPAGSGMDDAVHKYLHTTRGAQKQSGFAISGYTASSATSTQATMQAAIASGVIADEDLITTIGAVAAAGPYTHLYRSGATDWTWATNVNMFLDNGTDPYYNQLVTGSYQQTAISSGNRTTFWNQYVVALQATTPASIVIVQGQLTYASLAAAQGEDPNVNISGLSNISQEFVYLARLTFSRTASGTRYHNTLLESVQTLTTNALSAISGSNPGDHQSLSNRSAVSAHPASSISTDTTNFNGILSTAEDTVQKALDKLDDYGIYAGTFTATSITPNSTNAGKEMWTYTQASDQTFAGVGTLSSLTTGKLFYIIGGATSNILSFANNDATNGWLTNGPYDLAYGKCLVLIYNSTLARLVEVSRS